MANLNGAGANMIFPFQTTQYYSVTNYSDFLQQFTLPLYQFGGNSNTSISVNYPLSPANAPVYSNGGKTVVINLKGWKWSNGETVNAKDLMFFLNLLESEKAKYAGYTPEPAAGQHGVLRADRREPGDPAPQAGLWVDLVHL